ncbi:MAG: AmmeMemoRadiSam system radical SAM enzyme [bacterium]|nr:AmmeMemoRadiSam system radical SAM enzyme [bacterium]
MSEEGIVCDVCMHHCSLKPGQVGRCRARANINNASTSINYGKITSMALDPIEKKPLACFHPGSMILSVGSFGCNLNCPFCQNDSIAMAGEQQAETVLVTPRDLVMKAVSLKDYGNIGLAFTYNEPLIDYEFIRDASKLLHEYGMKSVVVTNGSITPEAAKEVLPYVDAYNIDLKGFTDAYYKKLGGDLNTVKEFIRLASQHAHVELTTLIVPGENDTEQEMKELSTFVASVDPDIPLHITRFFPRRNMLDKQPTDIDLLYRLQVVAEKQLTYVFVGNV